MTSRLKVALLALAVAAGIGAVLLLAPSQEEVLAQHVDGLKAHHPETAQKLAEAEALFPVRFEPAKLPGDALATTVVREDGATIRVDLGKIQARREWAAPALAHEVFHAWDASRDPRLFIHQVEAAKEMPWRARPHELRALAWENSARQALRARHPNLYRAMPERRIVHGDTP